MIDVWRERLRAIVTGTLALGACADREVPDTTTGETTLATPDTTTAITTTSPDPTTTTTPVTSDASGSTDATGMRLDFGSFPDIGAPPADCVDVPPPDALDCDTAPDIKTAYKCAPLPASNDCKDVDTDALLDATNECFASECFGPHVWNIICGPDPIVADACCYVMHYDDGQICPGRPLLVDGHCRLAPTLARSDWHEPLTLAPVADRPTRDALAAAFGFAAACEHASVASFSRFTLELLALAAPASLVERSLHATAEELEHARLFFTLASHHGGAPLGPGPLDLTDILTAIDLTDAALRAAAEGCIAETISAWQAAAVARLVHDPALAARLALLAEQELRHCELAWAFVRWALDRRPALRPALQAVFADAARHIPRGPALPDHLDPDLLRAHGLLPRSDRRRLAAEALTQLITPVARTLLAAPAEPVAHAC